MRALRGMFTLIFAGATLCVPAAAQSPPSAPASAEELRELRAEMARLRDEIAALRKELRENRAPAATPTVASGHSYLGNAAATPSAAPLPAQNPAASQQPSPAARLDLLEAQMSEHAQTKVESDSRWPVKIFGALLASTFWNTGDADWIDLPNVADGQLVAGGFRRPGGSIGITLRQTRLGATVQGPVIGPWRSSAVVAADFFGGVANLHTGGAIGIPRLLYAFVRLDGERTAIQVGQDHMIFAPNNPTSLVHQSFPLLFHSGNLYLRVPQVRVERVLASGDSGSLHFTGGIVAPVGANAVPGTLLINPPVGGGEKSRAPGFESRVSWRSLNRNDRNLEIGVSSHYNRLLLFNSTAGKNSHDSWGLALDFDGRAGRFGLGGEFFFGRNLGQFASHPPQFGRSYGGYAEWRVKATEWLDFNAGWGMDRLSGSAFDFSGSSLGLVNIRHTGAFANFIYQLNPELSTSFEYQWQSNVLPRTSPNPHVHGNHHLNLGLLYRF